MAFSVPTVLLPQVADLTKWAVIACDQFTAQPEYWEQLTELVGVAPSSLKFILPEVWLEERLATAPAEIKAAMESALAQNVLKPLSGYILVERTLANGQQRIGLLGNINLADYEYTPENDALIKATEATVPDRLPPRVAIRQAAPLEMPHALVLINDPEHQIIETLYNRRGELGFEEVYDFVLNMGGGHLRGWLVPESYGYPTADLIGLERDGVLALVGDGNHSIAAAKLAGDTTALVELINIHSPAIDFEPIHRIVIGAGADLIASLRAEVSGQATTRVYHNGQVTEVAVATNPADAIADVQQFLDRYVGDLAEAGHAVIVDYIHGDDELVAMADRHQAGGQDAVAIFFAGH